MTCKMWIVSCDPCRSFTILNELSVCTVECESCGQKALVRPARRRCERSYAVVKTNKGWKRIELDEIELEIEVG